MSLTNGKIFKLNSKILKTMDTQLEGFKPTNFNEVSFAGYGRDFKVNLELRNIEFY